MESKVQLHLGCGPIILPGFTNIDICYSPGVDDVADVRYLHPRKYPPNSADLIYASHILEHFNKWEYMEVLRRWYVVLKDGGVLRLAVPDFEKIVMRYNQRKDLDEVRGPLYGGQNFPSNYHYYTWDYPSLASDLLEVGFSEVHRWDWRTTEHAHIDDNSQAYLPHLDKENGMLMSLNVEGVK